MAENKDDTAAYERWLASRNLRGSAVLRGTSVAVPCEQICNGDIPGVESALGIKPKKKR